MSTKCTIMSETAEDSKIDLWYHFYYDYADNECHLKYKDEQSFQSFLNRVGKILEQCPLSDSGLYIISINDVEPSRVIKNDTCAMLKESNKKVKKNV